VTTGRNARLARAILRPGREKPVLGGHPWIFSGSIERLEGYRLPGDPGEILSAAGERLGFGYLNANSQIVCRVVSRDEPPGPRLWAARLDAALALRGRLASGDDGTDAWRLVNSEGDFLPGLIVDRYGSGLCVQFLTAGMERSRSNLLEMLRERIAPTFVYERSDSPLRGEEGLTPAVGLLSGALPSPLVIREGGLEFAIDPTRGHKTGFYLDQRDNRRLAGQLSRGVPVLNCFCYTGGFSVHAAAGGGAPVVSVDLSRDAVELARANLERNGCADAAARCVRADVFHHLRADRSRYGLIVLDPPKFARREGEVADAARGYHDINRLALERLAPGGHLLTFSCSQAVNLILFQQIVFEAAKEARQELQVLGRLGAGADHPFNACHREGEYLKGLWLRRVG
jgi:23S rRNA (cytosine1962-C5)-methyltransferase